jgi:DNA-directed RNA polymerase specialized sigma24 family protein
LFLIIHRDICVACINTTFLKSAPILDTNYSTQHALVESLMRRDPKGSKHLCESYSGKLFGYIIHIVNDADAAEHLLEKTFKKICKNIDQYKQSQLTFLTWAMQLARAESIDYLYITKLKTEQVKNSYINKSDETPAINASAILSMIHQGYKVFEVAGILGINVEEVKINIRKAMKQHTNTN